MLPASTETLSLENRSRSGMRSALSSLLNILDPDGSVTAPMFDRVTPLNDTLSPETLALMTSTKNLHTVTEVVDVRTLYDRKLSAYMPLPLKEMIDVRGFNPVRDRLEVHNQFFVFQ